MKQDAKLDWENKLNNLVDITKSKDDVDKIFDIFEIVLRKQGNRDMSSLYKLLGFEGFSKIINLYDGRTVNYSSVKDLEESMTLSLLFYYREVKHLEWKEIRTKLPFEINTHRYGVWIGKLNKYMKDKMKDMFEELK